MKKVKSAVLLTAMVFLASLVFALQPATISFAWDYNLAANSGATGFQLFTLQNDGSHGTLVADVPLPSPLPTPGADGFAVFTAQVTPDRTGRRDFVVVVVTADPISSSSDSNTVLVIVRPDRARNLR